VLFNIINLYMQHYMGHFISSFKNNDGQKL